MGPRFEVIFVTKGRVYIAYVPGLPDCQEVIGRLSDEESNKYLEFKQKQKEEENEFLEGLICERLQRCNTS